jgi:hypothetical protein
MGLKLRPHRSPLNTTAPPPTPPPPQLTNNAEQMDFFNCWQFPYASVRYSLPVPCLFC